MLEIRDLPILNATLNGTSAILLVTGYSFIRKKKILGHKICMIAAFVISMVFLTSYLVYHYHVGNVRFKGQGFIRPAYFSILISHTILAGLVPFLAITTLTYAFKGNFVKHQRIARVTLPIWLYVSVTGVVVFWMLYLSPWR